MAGLATQSNSSFSHRLAIIPSFMVSLLVSWSIRTSNPSLWRSSLIFLRLARSPNPLIFQETKFIVPSFMLTPSSTLFQHPWFPVRWSSPHVLHQLIYRILPFFLFTLKPLRPLYLDGCQLKMLRPRLPSFALFSNFHFSSSIIYAH